MNLENLIPQSTVDTIARVGLHKVAGAMYGVDEMTLKVAAQLIGMKAYARRKEAHVIANGLGSLAAIQGEKVAENPALMALLRRSIAPAAMGAGIAAVPHLMSNDPNQGSMLPSMGVGALLGGLGGGMSALNAAAPNGSQLNQGLASSLRSLP